VREKTHIKKHTKETIKEKDNAAYGSGSDKPSPTAANEPTDIPDTDKNNLINEQDRTFIIHAAKSRNLTNECKAYMKTRFNKSNTKELTQAEGKQLIVDMFSDKPESSPESKGRATEKQIELINSLMKEKGATKKQTTEHLIETFSKESIEDLTPNEADRFIEVLRQRPCHGSLSPEGSQDGLESQPVASDDYWYR